MAIDKNKIKQDYFTFDGTISKAEYISSLLVLLVIGLVLSVLTFAFPLPMLFFRILNLVSIIFLIALFSICIRRLRDLGQNPLWSLLLLIPFTGLLLIIYLLVAERKSIL